jgi:glycosyltransferase involved in cell wall biosynthesis
VKILITTTYFLPNLSGITIYIKILAEELVKKGHQVTILTSHHDLKSKKEEIINGVIIKREKVWFYLGKGPICPGFLYSSIKEIFKAQIINCHLPEPESVWVASWSKLFRKKVFLTHHTDLSFWKGIKNKTIDSLVFVCQYLACILATGIIPYTKDYANNSYLLKHFSKKIKPIYPPIRFVEKGNRKLATKINNKIKSKKYVIGFCGRIAKQKGIELLVEASKILDKKLKGDYIILMAGPKKVIGEKYYDYLQNKHKNQLEKRFVFLDNIPREHLVEFYRKLDLLVLPSDDILESFGWVQIEAMRCGTPCVATNLPGMRVPIIETGFGELFENRNKSDLAEKILRVLNKGKKYFQKRNTDKLTKFNYLKSIDQYEKLFEK